MLVSEPRLAVEALPSRLPEPGELVQVRSRRWLVERVDETDGRSAVVWLACADDDAQGEELDVYWDYELDRRILEEEGWAGPRAPEASTILATSPPFSIRCAGARSPRRIRTYSRRRFGRGSRSMRTRWSRCARRLRLPRVNLFIADDTGLGKTIEAGLIARELLLRQAGKDDRGRRAAVGARAVEGRARRALRAGVRDARPPVRRASAPRARVRREPVADPQPLPGLPQSADRSRLRRSDAGVARPAAAGEPADPRRGAPCGAVERRPVRDRDEVHARGPRSRWPVRAPAVPVGDAAQRAFEQLLDVA